MARARSLETGAQDGEARGAANAAPRSNPLTIVTAAVAGDDLQTVARSAADALGCTVAIALPAFGPAVEWPPNSAPPGALVAIRGYASALAAEQPATPPGQFSHAVPVHLGQEVVGVVAAIAASVAGQDPRPWLDAAAAAAAVTALMRDSSSVEAPSARRAFLQMLELQAPGDVQTLLAHGRRLGFDFTHGAVGVCIALDDEATGLAGDHRALLADVGEDRLLGLIPLNREVLDDEIPHLLEELGAGSAAVALSAPRRDPAELQEALREAALLLELLVDPRALLRTQEETYRLLVGVLIRNPDELIQLRTRTISDLELYDDQHDTELLATLEAFLAHHGSTTETAEAMSLHRHTVGYRLARVQEVSGLSPYESDGRERLSLGLKAHHIMQAEQRRAHRSRPT